jgi:DNA-binding GntR family transcriptional regulator
MTPPAAGSAEKGPQDPLAPLAVHRLEGDGRGASEHAYKVLRLAIVRGELEPGTVLGEAELGATLGISRTPVRAALKMLLSEDLVESGPRRQVLVRGVTPEQRREVLLVREALERLAVQEASKLMDIEQIDELRLLLIRQRRAAGNEQEEEFLDLDDEFHLGIARGAQLPIVERFLGQIRAISRLMGLLAVAREGRLEEVLTEHEEIVGAIEARDPERALAAIHTHLRNTAESVGSLDVAK